MTLQTAQTNDSKMREAVLAPYMPGRSELREFASRLKQSLSYRGADKLNDHELLALAAASRAHGLNPFLGEIWAIPGKGLMIGRAGWVKKLGEQLEGRGIRWWPQYLEVREHEREQYGIPKNAKLAYICELRRSDQLEAYMDALERMSKLGLPYDTIVDLVGKPPVIKGIGYIQASETQEGYMSFGERCKKRAFAQACKEIISLPFNVVTDGDIVDGVVLDGMYDESLPDGDPDPSGGAADVYVDENGEVVLSDDQPEQPNTDTHPERIEDQWGDLNRRLMSELSNQEAYFIQQNAPALIGMNHPKHFENRWKKRFAVKALKEISGTVGEFLMAMADAVAGEPEKAA